METTIEVEIIDDVERFLAGVPGLYNRIPEDVYHAFDACSQSRLKCLRDDPPAKLKCELDRKGEEDEEATKAQIFGRRAHACLLEPERFDERFAKADQCNGWTKTAGTRCKNGGKTRHDGKWFCGTHTPAVSADDIETVSEKDHNKLFGMRKACHEHDEISQILGLPSYREISGLWIDRATGLLCKKRIDILAHEHSVIVDYKTITPSVKEEDVRWAVWKNAYYFQAPFYLSGCTALGLPVADFAFIFQEKTAPYFCRPFRLDDAAVSVGVVQLRELMKRYKRAKESGIWAAYEDGTILPIGLPEKVLNYDLTDGERSAIMHGELTI